MTRLRVLLARLRGLFATGRLERELADEIESHLAMRAEENVKRGMAPDEARREALRAFGGVEQAKEAYRDRRGLPGVETLLQDLRYALRSLCGRPLSSTAVIATLAIGIGLNAAMFAVFDWVLLRPLPYPSPQQMVRVWSAGTPSPLAWPAIGSTA